MTFLAIDVGNTRLKWALYDAPRPGAALLAHGAEFLEHIERLAEHAWGALPAPSRILGCVVAGDAVKRRVREQVEQMLPPERARHAGHEVHLDLVPGVGAAPLVAQEAGGDEHRHRDPELFQDR